MKKTIFFFLVLVFCYACESDVPQKQSPQTIFAELFVRYLQNESALKTEATFKEGKDASTATWKEFTDGVKLDGQFMKFKNHKDKLMRYQLKSRNKYAGQYTFEVADQTLKDFKVTLGMTDIKNFQVDNPIIPKKGMRLSWDGDALQEDEKLVLLFSDENNKAYSCTITGPTPKSEKQISPAILPDMIPGKGQLYLVKKKQVQQNGKNQQVNGNIEFYTNSKEIVVGK